MKTHHRGDSLERIRHLSDHHQGIQRIDDQVDFERQLKVLTMALKTLPPVEQQILRLRYGLEDGVDYSHEAISQKMGISKSSVWKLEQSGLQGLRLFFITPPRLSPAEVAQQAFWRHIMS